MPELGTSGSEGGPGWATAQVYPWCAREAVRFSPSATPTAADDAAECLLRSRVLDESAAELAEFLEHETELDPTWRNAAVCGNTLTHLTIHKMAESSARLFELLRTYQRQDPDARPPDARHVRFSVYGLPRPMSAIVHQNDTGKPACHR